MPARWSRKRSCGHAQLGGGRRVGLLDDSHVALQRADDGDVELVVGLGLELDRLLDLGGARERVGVALHLEVHADLEQPQRRQLAHGLGAGLLCEHLERALEAELGVGLGGDREP